MAIEENQIKMGIDLILLFRLLEKQTEEDAKILLCQTEHNLGKTRENEQIKTKTGNVNITKPIEYDFSVTTLVSKGDKAVADLEEAFDKKKTLEVWEVDRSEKNETGKYKAEYFQVEVTEFTKNPNSEDQLELEVTFAVNQEGQKDFATLTEEQEDVIQYAFEDTVKKTTGGGE